MMDCDADDFVFWITKELHSNITEQYHTSTAENLPPPPSLIGLHLLFVSFIEGPSALLVGNIAVRHQFSRRECGHHLLST